MENTKKYLPSSIAIVFMVIGTFFFMYQDTLLQKGKLVTATSPKVKAEKVKAEKATAISYEGAMIISDLKSIEDIMSELDSEPTAAGDTFDLATMAISITAEALKSFSDSKEYALPLVSHWNLGIPEYTEAMDPMYMIGRIEFGEHILVSWKLDPYYNDSISSAYYEESVKKAAELQLPLVFVLPAPESALTKDAFYRSLDKEENPNVINANGEVVLKLSPFGLDSTWNEVGEQWSSTSLMAQLQEWYPNPPLVIFVSEDEADKLLWSEVDLSIRYTTSVTEEKDDNFKRTLVGAQWIEKYRQMHEGFKQGFTQNAWKENVKFITHNKLSDNVGLTNSWIDDATLTNNYMNIWPLTADGVTVDFDLTGTKSDQTADAPHILANNLPFMLDEAKAVNPNFSYQLNLNANAKIDDPARYRGLTQFALWFLRPSTIRQASEQTERAELEVMFQEVADSVELIHYNEVLADFWKNGELVNSGDSDLNQNIPEQYANDPRWFLLDVDKNPIRPWADDAEIPVWAFALVKGEAPNREWLVYAQSPNGDMEDVLISIPAYNNIELNTSIIGNFYILNENESINPIVIEDENLTIVTNSIYLEDVNIPEYDPLNNAHVLITEENGNWSSAVLNDTTKQHFYIEAGNYNRMTLTASGTEEHRRTISLHDQNIIHPGKLTDAEQANIALEFDNADYWTIHRMSNIDYALDPSFNILEGSSNNVFSMLHLKNYFYGFRIRKDANHNTIQNSYLNHMTHAGRIDDNVGIAISANVNENAEVVGTKIINNDIRNSGDGIQLVHFYYDKKHDFRGTIIDSNNIWMDSDTYTNGDYSTNGYNPLGEYQVGENAVDMKSGSWDVNNPIIFTNNAMWGYRTSDGTTGGSATVGNGTIFVVHFGVGNMKINNNIFFDSQQALTASGSDTGVSDRSMFNIEIKGNIFADMNLINPEDSEVNIIQLYETATTNFTENVLVNFKQNSLNEGYFFTFYHADGLGKFNNNVVISCNGTPNNQWDNESDNNYFYASTQRLGGTNDHEYDKLDEAGMESLSIEKSTLEINNESVLINSVISTNVSPHYNK